MSKKEDQDHENIRIKPPQKAAGGIGAVLSTLKFAAKEMGPLRGTQTLLKVNQVTGFDCPGCAWPDPDDRRSLVEFCENGAKAVAEEATRKRLSLDFFQRRSLSELSGKSDYWLGQQGRLTLPLWKKKGSDHYQEIAWDEAFEKVAAELKKLDLPDEAAFYTSGRTSNEAAFLYQLLVRLYGTNNLPDCSNMCHESSGRAMMEVVGSGKGTVTLEDFSLADLIIVIGQNPGTNHPRMLTALQEAKRKGAKIISINPLPEAGLIRFNHPQEIQGLLGRGTLLCDLFLQVKINGDVALLKGLMKLVLEAEKKNPHQGILDHEFIKNSTIGFTEFCQDLEKIRWEEILQQTGLAREELEEAARLYLQSRKTICCWAMGLTQHQNAVDNIREIANLLFLRGHIGLPGAGLCPVRGHSNVQGDRTMGIWERPTLDFLERLKQEFHFSPPTHHGYDVVEAIKAMAARKIKVLICLGGNLVSAGPDTDYTIEAIKTCRLTLQISTKLNRSHLVTGEEALIFPCLGRTEIDLQGEGPQFVTVENSMGWVHASQGHLPPAGPLLRSEPAVVAGLGKALFKGTAMAVEIDWEKLAANYDRIRDHISRVIPGFENFNQRIKESGGFYLPHPVRDQRAFPTVSGKAQFTVNAMSSLNLTPDQFLLMTVRSHDQYNTTIYGPNDRYRGVFNGRKVVFINPLDREAGKFQEGEWVDLISHYQGETRMVKNFRLVSYSIPRQCLATYFPEANPLVAIDNKAHTSHTPVSKSVIVSLKRSTSS